MAPAIDHEVDRFPLDCFLIVLFCLFTFEGRSGRRMLFHPELLTWRFLSTALGTLLRMCSDLILTDGSILKVSFSEENAVLLNLVPRAFWKGPGNEVVFYWVCENNKS